MSTYKPSEVGLAPHISLTTSTMVSDKTVNPTSGSLPSTVSVDPTDLTLTSRDKRVERPRARLESLTSLPSMMVWRRTVLRTSEPRPSTVSVDRECALLAWLMIAMDPTPTSRDRRVDRLKRWVDVFVFSVWEDRNCVLNKSTLCVCRRNRAKQTLDQFHTLSISVLRAVWYSFRSAPILRSPPRYWCLPLRKSSLSLLPYAIREV